MNFGPLLLSAVGCITTFESPGKIRVLLACNVNNATLTAETVAKMVGRQVITIQALERTCVWHNAVINPIPNCASGLTSRVDTGGVYFYPPGTGVHTSACVTEHRIGIPVQKHATNSRLAQGGYVVGVGLVICIIYLSRAVRRVPNLLDEAPTVGVTLKVIPIVGADPPRVWQKPAYAIEKLEGVPTGRAPAPLLAPSPVRATSACRP
jgi:hypothetical protein